MTADYLPWPDDPDDVRTGSLFSGYGGLEMGVERVLGGRAAWFCEWEKDPSKILAHHWPDVPNFGDITAVDWTGVERVHVVTGGSPCQDVSMAGKRRGMRAGTRSGLWASMVDCIDVVRPNLVVWENVRGALNAEANSEAAACPGCVGDEPGVLLRAVGRVLGDLTELGYDAQWHGLQAADIGAPHGRFRIFVVAVPAGTAAPLARGRRLAQWSAERDAWETGQVSVCGHSGLFSDGWPVSGATRAGVAYALRLRTRRGRVAMLPTPSAIDSDHPSESAQDRRDKGKQVNLRYAAVELLPTPLVSDEHNARALPDRDRGFSLSRRPSSRGGSLPCCHTVGVGSSSPTASRSCQVAEARLLPTPTTHEIPNRSGDRSDELLLSGLARSLAPDAPLLLPTPDAYQGQRGGSQHPEKRGEGGHAVSLADVTENVLLPTPVVAHSSGYQNGTPSLTEAVLSTVNEDNEGGDLLPTPTANMFKGPTRAGRQSGPNLQTAVDEKLLPTTRAVQGETRNHSIYERDPSKTQNLENVLAPLLPTPMAMVEDSKSPEDRKAYGHGSYFSDLPHLLGYEGRAEAPGPTAAEAGVNFGAYAPAIERWERLLGRPAPSPVERSHPTLRHPTGKWVLSPAFSEWMMGLPAAHVSDPAITINRGARLKACGNGVVPQQAAEALRVCLAIARHEVVA